MSEHVEIGDALTVLRTMKSESVQCVVTSPPYWGLRDYGVNGQLGLEKTPEEYVKKLVEIFREVQRVLRDDGTCWVNLGDSYSGGGSGMQNGKTLASPIKKEGQWGHIKTSRKPQDIGLKPKDLVGIPWMVAFALRADGWYLRSDIIWSKLNPMPESVTDRPTKAHEYMFLLTKSAKYFYDGDAVREELMPSSLERGYAQKNDHSPNNRDRPEMVAPSMGRYYIPNGRNLRSVWTIATQPFPEAHFATFPEKLVEPCIKAGTSEKGACPECGAPWARVVEKGELVPDNPSYKPRGNNRGDGFVKNAMTPAGEKQGHPNFHYETKTLGWQPTCKCGIKETVPCVVLDPFAGAGTTGVVAKKLNRHFMGIELKPEYAAMAQKRIDRTAYQAELILK